MTTPCAKVANDDVNVATTRIAAQIESVLRQLLAYTALALGHTFA